MIEFLQGKKSYIIAGLTFIYAIIGVVIGQIDVNTAIQLVLASGAVASLRAAIK
ncbi:MAG: hypothetical protein KGI08_00280 [Thaumarchaeota archaeon]|nr:hypothetical protein [Nitrososphaerota archaeon]